MSYQKNPDMSGALFKNEEKKGEKSPDYQGKAIVKGQQVYISAWINKSKDGKPYMALKFKEPDTNKPSKPQTKQYNQPLEDEAPF